MKEAIIKSEKYRRQHVALSDFRSRTIVGHGRNPKKVFVAALKRGIRKPIIVYVPAKDKVQILARDLASTRPAKAEA